MNPYCAGGPWGVLPHPCPEKSPEARGVPGLLSCLLPAVIFPSLLSSGLLELFE